MNLIYALHKDINTYNVSKIYNWKFQTKQCYSLTTTHFACIISIKIEVTFVDKSLIHECILHICIVKKIMFS